MSKFARGLGALKPMMREMQLQVENSTLTNHINTSAAPWQKGFVERCQENMMQCKYCSNYTGTKS